MPRTVDREFKIAAMKRMSDVPDLTRSASLSTVTKVQLRDADLASVHGHHIPGTAYTYKHGWIPREGLHIRDTRELDDLPEGAHIRHEFVSAAKAKEYRKMSDGKWTNLDDFDDSRTSAEMAPLFATHKHFTISHLPTPEEKKFSDVRHAIHNDDANYFRTGQISNTKRRKTASMSNGFGGKKAAPFVKGGGRSKTHPNDAKGRARKVAYAKALAEKQRRAGNIDNAITPGGRVGDASPLGKKGPRRLSDYEREVAHALMRKGHPRREAIKMARGIINKAAATGIWGRKGKARPQVVAGAAASIAQRKSFANPPIITDLDLAIDFCAARNQELGGTIVDLAFPFSRKEKVKMAQGLARQMIKAKSRQRSGARVATPPDPNKITLDKYGHDKSLRGTGEMQDRVDRENVREKTELNRRLDAYNTPSGSNRFGLNPSGASKEPGKPKSRSAKRVFRYRHGWIPINLSEPMVILDLAQIAAEHTLDFGVNGARWKHGYIPLNAAALAIKEHRAHGSGPSSGGKNNLVPNGSKPKFKSDVAKSKMTPDELRAHANAHANAAAASTDAKTKIKHVREAQSAIDASRQRSEIRSVAPMVPQKVSGKARADYERAKSSKSVASKPTYKPKSTPSGEADNVKFQAPKQEHVLPRSGGRKVTVHENADGTAVVKNHRGSVISEHKSKRSAAITANRHNRAVEQPRGWERNVARAKEESTREIERKPSIKEPPVYIGRKKGKTTAGGVAEPNELEAPKVKTKAKSKSKSVKEDLGPSKGTPEGEKAIADIAGPPKNPKLAKLDGAQLNKELKAAQKLPAGAARTRKLNALNAEKARRVAAVKALARQHREAQKFVDKSWPDGKAPLQIHSAFLKKLTKIFPAIRTKLNALRSEDGKVKAREVVLTVLDEGVRQFARTLLGPLIGSGLAGLGFTLATKGAG